MVESGFNRGIDPVCQQSTAAAGSATPGGIVQIVSGAGGKSHYTPTGGDTTVTKDNTSYGYSRLVLHPDSADTAFVPAEGSYTELLPAHLPLRREVATELDAVLVAVGWMVTDGGVDQRVVG